MNFSFFARCARALTILPPLLLGSVPAAQASTLTPFVLIVEDACLGATVCASTPSISHFTLPVPAGKVVTGLTINPAQSSGLLISGGPSYYEVVFDKAPLWYSLTSYGPGVNFSDRTISVASYDLGISILSSGLHIATTGAIELVDITVSVNAILSSGMSLFLTGELATDIANSPNGFVSLPSSLTLVLLAGVILLLTGRHKWRHTGCQYRPT